MGIVTIIDITEYNYLSNLIRMHRFRKEIIVVAEDVERAGHFLARALMAAIERRAPERGQFLDRPGREDLI